MSVRFLLNVLFLSLSLLCLAQGAPQSETESLEAFAFANALQSEGKGSEAIAAYEELLSEGWNRSPELYFNLAHAYHSAEDLPRALLNFYRASLLKPGWKAAHQNYQIVFEEADLGPDDEEIILSAAAYRFRDLLLGGGAAVVWAAIILGVLPIRKGKRVRVVLAILGVLLGLAAVTGGIFLYPKGPTPETAWVVHSEAIDLKSAPAKAASSLGSITPGEEIEIDARQEGWVYIVSDLGKAGWLPEGAVERVLLWMKSP